MSNIQWTDVSSNPIHLIKEDGSHGGHWCKKVSSGCDHCYSEAQNQSSFFSFASHLKYEGEAPSNLVFDEEICKKWLTWKKPKKIFVCSMTDLFGEWVKDEWIDKVFGCIAAAHWHTFQILTKRPERAIAYFSRPNLSQRIMEAGNLVCKPELPLRNVWMGTTAENQEMADKRIPLLLQIPAVVRWLSVEPLLGEVKLDRYHSNGVGYLGKKIKCPLCQTSGIRPPDKSYKQCWVCETGAMQELDRSISWVVVGGESGSGSRPCPIEWIEAIAHQCKSAGVPVFIKQLGNFPVTNTPENFPKTELITHKTFSSWCFFEAEKMGLRIEEMHHVKLKDRKGGNIEEFPEHLRIREFPDV